MPILVTDFDGTMTARDFYRVALERLIAPGTPDFFEDYFAGRMTHIQAMQAIFSAIHTPEAEVMAAARAMGLAPGLADAIARLQDSGWRIIIASAGCAWYIERLLAEQGITVGTATLALHALPGSYTPEGGLQLGSTAASPFYSPNTGIDKLKVVKAALTHDPVVAFAGDGRPDEEAALRVPDNLRFATGWLEGRLTARWKPFRRFVQWPEVAARLLAGG
jgi:2-hydroxy-3-keto-5-methylthiopentenyl-1-phosphate phosphatase